MLLGPDYYELALGAGERYVDSTQISNELILVGAVLHQENYAFLVYALTLIHSQDTALSGNQASSSLDSLVE